MLLRTTGDGGFPVGDLKIYPIARTVASATDSRVEFTKRRVASRGDERAGLSADEIAGIKAAYAVTNPGTDVPDKEYRKFRQLNNRPPLLMAMFVAVKTKDDTKQAIVVPAYGIGFLGTQVLVCVAHESSSEYRVNTVWWQKNVLTADEEEDTDE